jgi:hypothetical protein
MAMGWAPRDDQRDDRRLASLSTPSFIGVEPAAYTDANGDTVRPLGDIERDAFALINWLEPEQQGSRS